MNDIITDAYGEIGVVPNDMDDIEMVETVYDIEGKAYRADTITGGSTYQCCDCGKVKEEPAIAQFNGDVALCMMCWDKGKRIDMGDTIFAETPDTDPRTDDSEQDEETFVADMRSVATDIEDRQLRERRETFKAEITDVGYSSNNRWIEIECDVPTTGKQSFGVNNPDNDYEKSKYDFTDILSHFGQTLHHPKAIEGMALPVSYDSENETWEIAIDDDDDSGGFSFPSVPRPSPPSLEGWGG